MRDSIWRNTAVVMGVGLVMSVMALTGCGDHADSGPEARFEPSACPEPAQPIEALARARCGFLVVPEVRGRPSGRTIRLAVAIVPAEATSPAPDPVIYLTGGPGGSAIEAVGSIIASGANRDRDVIAMDQRGTLFSEPSLTCPSIDAFNAAVVGLPYDAPSTANLQNEATRVCRETVVTKGADPAAYNTTENAADFADLRLALGIEQWNVIGASYGTVLALTYMREHPQGIRSVTLDSVLPPDRAVLGLPWTSAGIGIKNTFRACAADPLCNMHYPELDRVFSRVVQALEAQPITAEVQPVLIPYEQPDPDAKPVKVVLDGGAFANWLINVNGAGFSSKIPRALYDFFNGNHDPVLQSQAATGGLHAGTLSFGLQYGVVCSEWVPFESQEEVILDGARQFPEFPTSVLAQPPQFPNRYTDCSIWDVPSAPTAQREVTRSTIPTLILADERDSLTGVQSAQYVHTNLPNSILAVFPGAGHVVLNTSTCARSVFVSFLSNPSDPDTACVAQTEAPPFDLGP